MFLFLNADVLLKNSIRAMRMEDISGKGCLFLYSESDDVVVPYSAEGGYTFIKHPQVIYVYSCVGIEVVCFDA